jgi:signal transduction histidine kinase
VLGCSGGIRECAPSPIFNCAAQVCSQLCLSASPRVAHPTRMPDTPEPFSPESLHSPSSPPKRPERSGPGISRGNMATEAGITVRHAQRRALEVLTSRLNIALRAARIGIYERDVSGDDLWWNESMYQLFERAPASFDPRDERWLKCVHPDDLDRVRRSSRGPLETGAIRHFQFRIVLPSGETRHLESIDGVGEGDAADSRIVGLLMDVTARTEAETRERDLQQQMLDTSHRAGMAEIATGVLHNVGNMVNSIGVANAAAARQIRALRLERARIQTVMAELDVTSALVDHLRQIVSAQQSAALFGGLLAPCNLEEVLEDTLRLHVRDQHHIEIQREYQALPPVVTDRHKLVQIVANLLSNARDALNTSGSGGLLRVRLFREEDDAVINIEDSGVGMSAEVLAKLWCFGFTTKPGGHGFGLHYCAKAAREIGAIITAHSKGRGHGSRVIIRLPMIRQAPLAGGT